MILPERDGLLSDFGKAILTDRYLLNGESYQDMFARVSTAYSSNDGHAQRIYDYMSQLWFVPATPVLANGGTDRGLPISCFLNEAEDSLESIAQMWGENVWLAAGGGGIGSYIGAIRSINEPIANKGYTSGIIPFVKVVDSMTLAISQGSLRRGSAAVYLDISHPEIEEFIDVRRAGGDSNRRCMNIHHGVVLSADFMRAVESGSKWSLRSPLTGRSVSEVSARELWIRVLNARLETGEPYLFFADRANEMRPEVQKKLGLKIKTSNLCSEITLPTGVDHLGRARTAVCCLSSVNLEHYETWEGNDAFLLDIMRFLDNVLSDFIERAPESMERAKYSAIRERSVGLGVMGFHSFLQGKKVPFESVVAKSWNKRIFAHIKSGCDRASKELAGEKGACPDAEEVGTQERFSNKMAIAPTASISIIANNSSPGIEPYVANVYTQKTLSGSFVVKNRFLKKLLQSKGEDKGGVWSSIASNKGSVSHLTFLTEEEKMVFKTAYEMNQMWIVEHSADRTPFICQAQSLNLFFPGDVSKQVLHTVHFEAAKKLKSLYYCRSTSIQRADTVSNMSINANISRPTSPLGSKLKEGSGSTGSDDGSFSDEVVINEDDGGCLGCQ